ncbi:15953_t:CDS:2 [Cetraspora pellucida]|uniref:15953_t:CDS:1 n=1 Tax=Cetraspora pellucida TaxID=1433469 RepID=A0ACA9LIV8_9GLOM|nr:15953_t:CDS:2 [Cetraspora pellucida]
MVKTSRGQQAALDYEHLLSYKEVELYWIDINDPSDDEMSLNEYENDNEIEWDDYREELRNNTYNYGYLCNY